MATIPISFRRPKGPDPRFHYWFENDAVGWTRLCDGSLWPRTFHLRDDFHVGFAVHCHACAMLRFVDEVEGKKVFRVAADDLILDWQKDNNRPWVHNTDQFLFWGGGMPRAPMSVFTKFCAEEDRNKQTRMVQELKRRVSLPLEGRDGFNPYGRFLVAIKGTYRCGHDFEIVRDCLTTLISQSGNNPSRMEILRDSFLSQWQANGYRFFQVHGREVEYCGLTIRVIPDIGVLLEDGREIAVKMWLAQGMIPQRRREATIALLDVVRGSRDWPTYRPGGLWDLEQGVIDAPPEVPESWMNRTRDAAERFLALWNQF